MTFHSDTRWWNKREILKQVSDYFGDVEPFLREDEEMSPASRRRIVDIFDDYQDFLRPTFGVDGCGRCWGTLC